MFISSPVLSSSLTSTPPSGSCSCRRHFRFNQTDLLQFLRWWNWWIQWQWPLWQVMGLLLEWFAQKYLKGQLLYPEFDKSILLPLVDWCLFLVSSRRKQLSPVFEGWSLRWWWCDDGSSDVAHTGAWYSCLIIGRLLVYFSVDSQATGSVWENSELTKGVNVSGFNWTTTAGIGSSSTFHYSIIFNFIFFQTLHD